MADKNVGKIIQVISAVLDIKFSEGNLPEINDAVEVPLKNVGKLVVEVAQHLGDDTVRCIPWDLLMVSSAAWTLSQQEHIEHSSKCILPHRHRNRCSCCSAHTRRVEKSDS